MCENLHRPSVYSILRVMTLNSPSLPHSLSLSLIYLPPLPLSLFLHPSLSSFTHSLTLSLSLPLSLTLSLSLSLSLSLPAESLSCSLLWPASNNGNVPLCMGTNIQPHENLTIPNTSSMITGFRIKSLTVHIEPLLSRKLSLVGKVIVPATWTFVYHAKNFHIARQVIQVSVRNYRLPSRHWRLTFRVGDDQLATWSPKKKKKKERKKKNSSSRESFAKKAGRSGASILSSILPLRIDWERNKDRETPICHVHGGAELCSRCFPHVRSQDRKQRDKTTPCHNTQLESRFTFLPLLRRESRKKADGSRADILLFRFGSIGYKTRIAKLSPVACMRGTTALQCCVCSHFSFHTCGGEN